MPTLIVVDRKGHEKTIAGDAGLSVMEVIRDNGFDEMLALCGGCCSCATWPTPGWRCPSGWGP